MKSRTLILATAALASTFSFASFSYAGDYTSAPAPVKFAEEKKMDIVETAMSPGMPYSTLVTAIKKAGLVETLKSPGPFTVFATTDDAFKKLPDETLNDLLKPENKDKLVKVLTFNVVAGKHPASEVTGMTETKSVEGSPLMIKQVDGKWMIGNDKAWATIIKTDVQATNGVIHWIDTVLMP